MHCVLYIYICFRLLMLKTIWCDFIIIFLNIEIWYWVVLIVNIYVKALSSFHAFQCFCDMQQYFFLHWIWMNPHECKIWLKITLNLVQTLFIMYMYLFSLYTYLCGQFKYKSKLIFLQSLISRMCYPELLVW